MDTDTPATDRVPTWADLRETVLARGVDPQLPDGPPGGLARGQLERWQQGHNYAPREIAEPAPPKRPARRVVVRGVDRQRTAPSRTAAATDEAATLGRLVDRLRAEGVPATLAQSGTTLRIQVPDGHRAHAETLLGRWAIGS